GEKRNHPGSKLRQGFWMVFRLGVNNWGRIIQRYSELANVKRIQGKGLRHSNASYLINEFNVSVLILSKRLGHSSPEITLKHYSHLWRGADESIAEIMSGNISIHTAPKTKIQFNGNQNLKR
ncbi:site-specific integrase, partial [Streptococcus pneumoniae]